MHRSFYCSLALLLLTAGVGSPAVESPAKFLETLRAQGYYDVALDYLDRLRAAKDVPAGLRDTLDYETGVTLLGAARHAAVITTCETQLGQARARLEAFLKAQPDHALAPTARRQLAAALVQWAKLKLDVAAQPSRTAEERRALREEARRRLDAADRIHADFEQAAAEALEEFPKIIPERESKQRRSYDACRRELLEARLARASLQYETAQTFPAGSETRRARLLRAVAAFSDVCEKHNDRLVGVYARLWEGRCHKELGDATKALAIFEEILQYPDEPAFHGLREKATALAVETAVAPDVKKYGAAAMLYREWLARLPSPSHPPGAEESTIRYFGGMAALEAARALDEKDADQAAERESLLRLAHEALQAVERQPGPRQHAAREALAAKELAALAASQADASGFAAARDRGDQARARVVALLAQRESARQRQAYVAAAKLDDEIRKTLAASIREYRAALTAPTGDESAEDRHAVRYYLAHALLSIGEPREAAALAESVVRQAPRSVAARPAAVCAIEAQMRLIGTATDADVAARLLDRMTSLAEFVASKWRDEPETQELWLMLVEAAAQRHDPAQAQAFLAKIPADAPGRAEAEMRAGRALWREAWRAVQGEPAKALRSAARDMLRDGVERRRKTLAIGESPDAGLLRAACSRAEIELDRGEPEAMWSLLDDQQTGPLRWLLRQAKPGDNPELVTEAARTALLACAATRDLDRLERLARALERLLSDEPQPLRQTYADLGRDVQRWLDHLERTERRAEAEKLANACKPVLERIAARDAANHFVPLSAIADALLAAARSLDADPEGPTSATARVLYEEASKTYLRILPQLRDTEFGAPASADIRVKLRLASCYRRLGEFGRAVSLVRGVLREKPGLLAAQFEAAACYKNWAAAGLEDGFEVAIRGPEKYKEIWGWETLLKKLIAMPAARDILPEAGYNLAWCRLRLAEGSASPAREELLRQAAEGLLAVYQVEPTLGGKLWLERYDELLKRVQKLKGERPEGLPGVKQ